MRPNERKWFDLYKRKLNCIDQKILINGDYDSTSVKHLQVRYVKCDPELRADCKSDEEITEYLKEKYIVIAHN